MSLSDSLNAAWNSQDPARVADEYAVDGVRHQFAMEEVRLEGRDAIREMITAIMHSMPDCSLEVRNQFAADGSEAFDWTFRATVQNDFGPIPGNGQTIELPGCSVLHAADDGLIAEERVYWDGAYFLAGAGLLS